MFTGIVTDIGQLIEVIPINKGIRLRVETAYDVSCIKVGSSIAHSGVCLTVTSVASKDSSKNWYEVEVWQEAIDRTTVSSWRVGDQINLERSLKIEDELGGHIMLGHVDGVAKIIFMDAEGDAIRCRLRIPKYLEKFIAVKGSVALDGTSLTVNSLNESSFDVLLVQHTLKVTTWKIRKKGDFVNLEVDTIARYISRLLEHNNNI
ncbi:Riboflavin synthase alpha chain [Liberibacter crescens BT-1]|uniref:Riboflavin synthase n=1 Tax=Liberibacter crescens (strain BT-1) TaxID=1215343 RepID=L0EWR4_LIBCB|nr:riboflavin synthase [Liberibacter crescens]AGA65078.1 Riboflavin synthase alpha chain [Liberibacter crescens BT-1]AMC13065.1 riboflavin synthase subunit alpha [Liberibacter crescens]